MSSLILVVDDESDVEMLFRQQFRRDLRAGRFAMDFARSADTALQHINDTASASLVLILSDINMPGMSDDKAHEIRFVRGRLKFGDGRQSAPFPSMIAVFLP